MCLAKTNMYLVGFWDLCIFVLVQIYYIFLSQTQCIHFNGLKENYLCQFRDAKETKSRKALVNTKTKQEFSILHG